MKKISKLEFIGMNLLFIVAFAAIGHMDYQDQLAAEAHARHVQQLAKRDADERKAEFNFLAKQAADKTGFEAVMK